MKLTDVIQRPQEAVERIAALSRDNDRLRSQIAELKTVGNGLAKRWVGQTHLGMFYCVHCGDQSFEYSHQIIHTPDCPVTEWQQLLKKIEEER